MGLVASLGMYDDGPCRTANDGLWTLIAERLVRSGISDVPLALDRTRSLDAIWSDPDLLLGQCCGYPFVTRYRDRLRYVATPRYHAPGCVGPSYRSRIVVRIDDPAATLADLSGRRAAMNEATSHSGMNLFRAAIAPLARDGRFFAGVVETGSHARSLQAVVDGGADVAAIDAVSFAHMLRDDPGLVERVRTISWTSPSPSLPLVTSGKASDAFVALLRRVLAEVFQDERAAQPCGTLLIDGLEHLPVGSYDQIATIERQAAAAGYTVLA